MSNFIIGTSGHIDHGKTTLIKALTGRETDRLEEEKQRGISIELGFTYFDLPNGQRAGIVDVPGHEKFLKNMLAGVSGMDVVMLVIAADEGIMKQTKEHLDILKMLDVHEGIIVLTKIDMVDEDWLLLVQEDVREFVKGTFLENSPIIPVSSTKGIGIEHLIETLTALSESIQTRADVGVPRLPIDRVFTIQGFGTVVTGTQLTGAFKVGDEVEIYPKNIKARIRSIQVHGEDAEKSHAGQRVALNIANVKKSAIDRGDIVALPGTFENTMMLDCKVVLLKDAPRIIENRTRLRLYVGAKEVLCRAVLLDKEMLTPGDEGYVQLRLEEEIIARKGDKFVIRFYSPMETIGGGTIIEANPKKKKRFDEHSIQELLIREQGSFVELIENKMDEAPHFFISKAELEIKLSMKFKEFEADINTLIIENQAIQWENGKETYYISMANYRKLADLVQENLADFHKKYPLREAMPKEELKSKFLANVPVKVIDAFWGSLAKKELIALKADGIALFDHKTEYTGKALEIKNHIIDRLLAGGYSPVNAYEIIESYDQKTQILAEEVMNTLVANQVLNRVSDILVYHSQYYGEAEKILVDHLLENGTITMAEFRDKLGTSRKYAMALLEDFDKRKLTLRDGDVRRLFRTQS